MKTKLHNLKGLILKSSQQQKNFLKNLIKFVTGQTNEKRKKKGGGGNNESEKKDLEWLYLNWSLRFHSI